MSQKAPDIATMLKNHGLSMTKQRQVVFDALEGKEPLSMAELYDRTKDQLDRASLYRTVGVFEDLGIITRVNIGWKYKLELSDVFADHHHHLTCTQCQNTIAISEEKLEDVISQLASAYAFEPSGHQIEIQGLCQECRNTMKGKQR